MKVVRAFPLDLSVASATQRSPAELIGDLCSPRNFLIDLPADLMRKGQGEHASDTALKDCGKLTSARHPGISMLAGNEAGWSRAAAGYSEAQKRHHRKGRRSFQ